MISLAMDALIGIAVILGFLYIVVTAYVFIRDGGFWYDGCKHLRKCPLCGCPLFTGQHQCNDCGWVQTCEKSADNDSCNLAYVEVSE